LLTQERDELLEQLTATSEVLRVISSSPADLQPVLEAVARSAARLCKAYDAAIWLPDGERLRLIAHYGPILVESLPLVRENVGGRSVLDKQTVHIADVQTETDEFPDTSESARRLGFHTVVCVPFVSKDIAIGAIALRRKEAHLFTQRQVALLETFAAQATIAIENARLVNDLRQRSDDLSEALEQQTATSEVLKVISSSPGDLAPVFRAMLQNAVGICSASFGMLFLYQDNAWRAAAMFGVPAAFAKFWNAGPQRPGRRTALGRVAETRQAVQIVDVMTEPAYIQQEAIFSAAVKLGGFRTILNVPMLKESDLLGAIAIYRTEWHLSPTNKSSC
jgi:GAF domain-containing protein